MYVQPLWGWTLISDEYQKLAIDGGLGCSVDVARETMSILSCMKTLQCEFCESTGSKGEWVRVTALLRHWEKKTSENGREGEMGMVATRTRTNKINSGVLARWATRLHIVFFWLMWMCGWGDRGTNGVVRVRVVDSNLIIWSLYYFIANLVRVSRCWEDKILVASSPAEN